MASATVKKGDTVWALARKELIRKGTANPTNVQIQRLVNQSGTPSGNKNLIRPGESVRIGSPAGVSRGGGSSSKKVTKDPDAAKGVARAQSNPGAARRSSSGTAALAKVAAKKAAAPSGRPGNVSAGRVQETIAKTPGAKMPKQTYGGTSTRNTSTGAGVSAQAAAKKAAVKKAQKRRAGRPQNPAPQWAGYASGRSGR